MTTDLTNISPLRETDAGRIDAIATGMASLVWWTFSGTKIAPDDLRSRVSAAGMDPTTVKDIDPVQALRAACRDFSIREGRAKVMEAVIASEDNAEVRVNLLKLTKQGRKVAKLPVQVMVWDKTAQGWTEQPNTAPSVKLAMLVKHRQTYLDGNSVRDLLVMPALNASQCFTLRRGMYVVPHSTAQPLAEAQAALAGLESFNLHCASVHKGQGWEAPMQEAAQDQLRGDLDELREQIEGWKDMASRVRSDTQLNVMERFSALHSRATLYMDALEVSLDDLQDDIADLEAMAQEVIDLKDAEAENKETDKKAPADPAQLIRDSLAAMPRPQLELLWDALCDGDEMPDQLELLVEQIAQARGA